MLHKLILTMSESYMTLMPEAVPFLAELNEDEDEQVEKFLHQVLGDLEQILGEPINKYFKN